MMKNKFTLLFLLTSLVAIGQDFQNFDKTIEHTEKQPFNKQERLQENKILTESTNTSSNSSGIGMVGINTENPQATLDIKETELNSLPEGQPQGVSFPNFTSEQRSSFKNVKEGNMIFNTTLKCIELYDGTSWKCIN